MKRPVITGIVIWGLSVSLAGQMNEKRTLSETSHKIYDATYSPSGEFIATTGSDNNIIIWNAETGIIHRTLVGLKKRPNQVVFSRNSKLLYSAGEDGLIATWDATLVRATATTPGHAGAIKSLDIRPDGTMLITGGEDKILRAWSIKNGSLELLYELKGHKKTITCVDFSPDGLTAVSGSADKTLALWDMQTGSLIRELEAHSDWVSCVRFSPDGKEISSGGYDRLIRSWDARDLSAIRKYEGHTGWVQCLSYTPSGKHLISGGHDQTIRIWDTETGAQQAVSEKLEQIVLSVDASPVRNDFISACLLSEKLRIWVQSFPSDQMAASPHGLGVQKAGREEQKIDQLEQEPVAVAAVVQGNQSPGITIFSPMTENGRLIHNKSTILIVGKAEAEGGIQTLVINRQRATLNEAGVFQAEVGLVKGENLIEVVAVSNKGKMGSSHMVIQCTDESASAPAAEQPALSMGKYYALIIGINEYEDENITDLDYPIQDADSIYNTLVSLYNFNSDDITFLKNPTRTEMIIALDELGGKITPDDNLLIFYAGHGFWDEKSGIGYWLPHDAARSNTANWFRNSTLRDFIGSIQSRHTLLIADACFSGSIFKSRAGFSAGEQGVMKLHDLPSRKAMTSGALKEVPDESVFVKYLVRELKQNKARFLPSEALFGNFKTAVLNNSPSVPQYGTIQNVGDEGGDFIFIRK
ncbi:MAG: caspase family protein [Bacteroidota bacterium]